MRRGHVAAAVALCALAAASAIAWGQQSTESEAKAAQARVEAMWTAISRGNVDGIVECMNFPVTLIEVSAEDTPGLVEAKTEQDLRHDLGQLSQNAAAPAVKLVEATVQLAGHQMACVRYRLPANTGPLVGPEGPSEPLITVLAKVDGTWKVIATGLPM